MPKFYKQNTIIGDLDRSKRISSGFNTKVRAIKNEYNNAGYLLSFIGSIVNSVNMSSHDNLSVIISPNFLLVEVPYCKINETAWKKFFSQFTNQKCDVTINWIKRTVKLSFKVKSRSLDLSCKI